MSYPSLLILTVGESNFYNKLDKHLKLDADWSASLDVMFIDENTNLKRLILFKHDLILIDWATFKEEKGILEELFTTLDQKISWLPIFDKLAHDDLVKAGNSIGYLLEEYDFKETKSILLKIHQLSLNKYETDPAPYQVLIWLKNQLCDVRVCYPHFPFFNKEVNEVFDYEVIEILATIDKNRTDIVRTALCRAYERVKVLLISSNSESISLGQELMVTKRDLPDRVLAPESSIEKYKIILADLEETNDFLSNDELQDQDTDKWLIKKYGSNWRKGIWRDINILKQCSSDPKSISINNFWAIRKKMLIPIFILSHQAQAQKCNRLITCMAVLKREKPVEIKSSHDLLPDNNIDVTIIQSIEYSKINITIVCPDFLAGEKEMMRLEKAIDLYHEGIFRFFLIEGIICDWRELGRLSHFQNAEQLHDAEYFELETDQDYQDVVTVLHKHIDDLLCRA
jgi:hypothetical protein